LKPYSEWKNGKTKADLIEELAAEYAKMPGYNVAFSQPMIDGVMDILNQKRFLYSFSYKPLKINIISQENLKNHFNHSIK
jgi:hypothetical protein